MDQKEVSFHDRLKMLIHEYILLTYELTKRYPDDERFGMTSQDRRASVSVMLNYVEGYARFRDKVTLNFYEISHGSLKESMYVKYLALNLKYIHQTDYNKINLVGDEIGAMLFSTIRGMREKINK